MNIIPPLGKEGNAGAACKTYLSRRQVWDEIKKEASRKSQELTPYSFRNRYAYYGHYRPKVDGTYRSSQQIADAMGNKLDTHLISYSRSQTKELASDFVETSLLIKVPA